MTTKSYS